jgi:hypothetical protein
MTEPASGARRTSVLNNPCWAFYVSTTPYCTWTQTPQQLLPSPVLGLFVDPGLRRGKRQAVYQDPDLTDYCERLEELSDYCAFFAKVPLPDDLSAAEERELMSNWLSEAEHIRATTMALFEEIGSGAEKDCNRLRETSFRPPRSPETLTQWKRDWRYNREQLLILAGIIRSALRSLSSNVERYSVAQRQALG